jgi:hypothetical protein
MMDRHCDLYAFCASGVHKYDMYLEVEEEDRDCDWYPSGFRNWDVESRVVHEKEGILVVRLGNLGETILDDTKTQQVVEEVYKAEKKWVVLFDNLLADGGFQRGGVVVWESRLLGDEDFEE